MERRLFPLLKRLCIAQQLKPQLDGVLARVPAQELLQGRQKDDHGDGEHQRERRYLAPESSHVHHHPTDSQHEPHD